jgi:DNA-binding transcriptional LysR family regulator
MVPCASPRHIDDFGPVNEPDELSSRAWVSISIIPDSERITLVSRDGKKASVRVSPVLQTNSGLTAKQLVVEGSCAGLLPS